MSQSEDFLARYNRLCQRAKVCPLTTVKKYINGTEFSCPVEAIRSEQWPFLLATLSVDNTLTKVQFESCLPLHTDKSTTKKKKINSRGFPTPYGRTLENIAKICKCIARLLNVSRKLVILRLENLPIQIQHAEILSKGLKVSKVKEISFAGCFFSKNAVKIICSSLHDAPVEWINFTSCRLRPDDLLAVNDLLLAHKNRRLDDLFEATLRYQVADFDSFEGLKRISLNDNDLFNHGVSELVRSLEDDHWIKALDLYRCSLGNEGGKLLLHLCKRQTEIELIDVRFSNIEESILRRIGQQLNLNRTSSDKKYQLMQVWVPPRMINRNLKIYPSKKVVKKPPPVVKIVKVVENPDDRDDSTAFMLNRGSLLYDVGSQTDPFEDPISDELIIGEAKKMRKSLLGELKVRRYLTQEIEKHMNENKYLRSELRKLSEQGGAVVIDKETYLDVKRTFEKFKRFLDIMKDYGLWDFVKLLGVNEDAEIVLLQDDPQSKMQVKVIEPNADGCDNSKGNFSCKPGKLCKNVSEPQSEKCCQRQEKKQKLSDHLVQCQNSPDYSLSISNTKAAQAETKKTKSNVNSLDKECVLKFFKNVRENYCKENVPNQDNKSEAEKTSDSVPETIHPKDCPNCHACFKQLPPSTSVPEKLKHLKYPAEFIKVVKSELEKCPHQPLLTTCKKLEQSNSLAQGSSVSSDESNKKANFCLRKKFVQSCLSGEKLEKILNESAAVKAVMSSSSHHSVHSNNIDICQANPIMRKKRLSQESVPGRKCPVPIPVYTNSVKSNSSKGGASDVSLKGESECPEFGYSQQESSHQVSHLNEQLFTEKHIAEMNSLSKRNRSVLSNSESSLSDRSSSSHEQLGSSVRSLSNSSSEKSFKGQSLSKKSKNLKHSSSGETLHSEKQATKSYLESVSDDSTSKDARSFSEIEVSSQKNSDLKQSNSLNQNTVSSKGENRSSSRKNNSKSKTESCKHSKKSSNNEAPKFSPKDLIPDGKVTSQRFEKKEESSSVPSLSDITSVSSHSMNTDSIMHQISE